MTIGTIKIGGVERPAVDDEAYELAEHFLSDGGPLDADECWALAGAIQQAVEDWFDSREHAASLTAMGATEGDESLEDSRE